MFRTVPLSIIRNFSLYTQQRYMSYRFAYSLRAGSGWNVIIILNEYLGGVKTEKMKTLLFMGRRTEAFDSTIYKEERQLNSLCCLAKIILYYGLFQMNLSHLYKGTPSKLKVASTHGHLRPFYISNRVTPMLRRVSFRQVTKRINKKKNTFHRT